MLNLVEDKKISAKLLSVGNFPTVEVDLGPDVLKRWGRLFGTSFQAIPRAGHAQFPIFQSLTFLGFRTFESIILFGRD